MSGWHGRSVCRWDGILSNKWWEFLSWKANVNVMLSLMQERKLGFIFNLFEAWPSSMWQSCQTVLHLGIHCTSFMQFYTDTFFSWTPAPSLPNSSTWRAQINAVLAGSFLGLFLLLLINGTPITVTITSNLEIMAVVMKIMVTMMTMTISRQGCLLSCCMLHVRTSRESHLEITWKLQFLLVVGWEMPLP